jgi:hypothetical protein
MEPGGGYQPSIPKDERCGLLMHTATTVNGSLCTLRKS